VDQPISREIRVFLSSTFLDMEAERNHLAKVVFPKIRLECGRRLVGFTEVDLRWGITEEDAKNGATVEICLQEIDRCRDFPPFFIGFLGERYGWVPSADELATYWTERGDTEYAAKIREAVVRGYSVMELEMDLAVLGRGDTSAADRPADLSDRVLFLLRSPDLTAALYAEEQGARDGDFFDDGGGKLNHLKDRIRDSGLAGIDGYGSLDEFGRAVEDHFQMALDRYFPLADVPDASCHADFAQRTFRWHRLRTLVPRPDVQAAILGAVIEECGRTSPSPILLSGPSGQGKSTILADLARQLDEHPDQAGLHLRVIDHYVGANGVNTLDGWCSRVLGALLPDISDLAEAVPKSIDERRSVLSTWISLAARRAEHRLIEQGLASQVRFVLVIDALDQLEDGGSDLHLIGEAALGPDAIVVVSAVDGSPVSDRAGPFHRIVTPPLDNTLAAQIVRSALARYGKTLPDDQSTRLIESPQSRNPLFLTLAIENLRLNAQHKAMSALVGDILTVSTAEELFLKGFALDPAHSRPRQLDLAITFVALLGASRAGLAEGELADLLALPDDPFAQDSAAPRLPQVHLSRLLNSFGPFLLDNADNRTLMHRGLGEAACRHVGLEPMRERLYAYFRKGYLSANMPDGRRGAIEAIHQLTELAQGNLSKGFALAHLREDLAPLMVAICVLAGEQEVFYRAMRRLSDEEVAQLTNGWCVQVAELIACDIERWGAGVSLLSGWITERLGNFDAALSLQVALRNAVVLSEGEEHPLALSAYLATADTYYRKGDLEEAQDRLECLLELYLLMYPATPPDGEAPLESQVEARIRLFGKDSFSAKETLLLAIASDGEGALADLRRAGGSKRRRIEEVLPQMRPAVSRLGLTLLARGELNRAKALLESVSTAHDGCGTDGRRDPLWHFVGLASARYACGELAEARLLLEAALKGRGSSFGAEHPDTLTIKANLANVLGGLGLRTEAKAMIEDVLDVRRRILGDRHPAFLETLNNLAAVLQADGDVDAAAAVKQSVVVSRHAVLGEDHPDTLTARFNLANVPMARKRWMDARTMLEPLLDDFIRVLGPTHPNTLKCMCNTGIALLSDGDLQTARGILHLATLGFASTLGADHPETRQAMENTGYALIAVGEHSRRGVPLRFRWMGVRKAVGQAVTRLRHRLGHGRAEIVRDSVMRELERQEKIADDKMFNPDYWDSIGEIEMLAAWEIFRCIRTTSLDLSPSAYSRELAEKLTTLAEKWRANDQDEDGYGLGTIHAVGNFVQGYPVQPSQEMETCEVKAEAANAVQLRDLFNKAVALGERGHSREEIVVYDEIVTRFGAASDLALCRLVARSLYNKGFTLAGLGRGEEAVAAYDEIVARFGAAADTALREDVGGALVNKGVALAAQGRGEDAVVAYDEVVARFGTAAEPALREETARAIMNKGIALGKLGRNGEEMAAYDEVVTRFGDATETAIRDKVAKALINKGRVLRNLSRGDEADAVFAEIIRRFADATEPGIAEIVTLVRSLP